MNTPVLDPTRTYRLTPPGEDAKPGRYGTRYATPAQAWAAAAKTTLDPDTDANPDNPDRMEVARHLLGCDDAGVMWGWTVTRYADTVSVPLQGHRLSTEWDDAIRLHCPEDGSLLGTFEVVARALLDDLIEDEQMVDVALIAGGVLHIGVAQCVEGSTLTFTDEVAVPLLEVSFVAAMYR